jgi:lysophospholipase L1-like esterase
MSLRGWSALLSALVVSGLAAQERPLPKVVLIGDSIRMGYAPLVAKQLEGKATIISSSVNAEDSGNVLKHLDEWVISEQPDFVHINAGLHDLKRTGPAYQVPLGDYEKNLKTILQAIRTRTKAKIVFATSTPIIDDLHAQRKTGFDRFEADVQKYNAAAIAVMTQERIPINDLHKLVVEGGTKELMGPDGTHYTPAGYDALARAVVKNLIDAGLGRR